MHKEKTKQIQYDETTDK